MGPRHPEETLGQRLQRLRKAAGLSLEELAARVAIPVWSIRNWEYDHRVPGLGAASLLAKALGAPLQDLADCAEALEVSRQKARREARRQGTASGPTEPSRRPRVRPAAQQPEKKPRRSGGRGERS